MRAVALLLGALALGQLQVGRTPRRTLLTLFPLPHPPPRCAVLFAFVGCCCS